MKRRPTSDVRIGKVDAMVHIGSGFPVLIQSMTDTSTNDVEASAAQCLALAKAGAGMVRLTAQGVSQAESIGLIKEKLHENGCDVPLSADIHFNPAAAFAAALTADKVRINPGNFVDPGRTFRIIDYDDESYAAELKKLDDKLVPLINLCRERSVALRIGVNHGSLSDRIMSRYGDTPEGVAESAMEFLRICRRENFDQVVVSVKASNVRVMTTTVRLLVKRMAKEGMNFPLHLGVTEAGDGDMARIKSAIGIGSLLADGIGDTIRVSLSEDPVNEIPAARLLAGYASEVLASAPDNAWLRDFSTELKPGAKAEPLVAGYDFDIAPEACTQSEKSDLSVNDCYEIVTGNFHGMRCSIEALDGRRPVLLRAIFSADMPREEIITRAALDIGSLLLEGYGSAIDIVAPGLDRDDISHICLDILQASRRRISQTEYIACPGCGRTLYNLQETLAKVKEATKGFPGLKIAVMGCVVNGPGEMADADYGYVGAGVGKVSVYKGKTCVYKNIDPDEALGLMLALIESDRNAAL